MFHCLYIGRRPIRHVIVIMKDILIINIMMLIAGSSSWCSSIEEWTHVGTEN